MNSPESVINARRNREIWRMWFFIFSVCCLQFGKKYEFQLSISNFNDTTDYDTEIFKSAPLILMDIALSGLNDTLWFSFYTGLHPVLLMSLLRSFYDQRCRMLFLNAKITGNIHFTLRLQNSMIPERAESQVHDTFLTQRTRRSQRIVYPAHNSFAPCYVPLGT